jgi:hypothetical protein
MNRPDEQTQPFALVPGQKFITYRQFRSGSFVPDVILANRRLSCGAKLLWARLARYAGSNGACFPSTQTLGRDLGCSARQVQRHVAELVEAGFIQAKQRGSTDRTSTRSSGILTWRNPRAKGLLVRRTCRPALVRRSCRPALVRHSWRALVRRMRGP